jgi:hypothetical protein
MCASGRSVFIPSEKVHVVHVASSAGEMAGSIEMLNALPPMI